MCLKKPVFAGAALAAVLSLGVVALSGCGASPGVSAKVDAAVVGLTAAENAALLYTRLPRCPAPAPCSTQATVDLIKAADNRAYAAVKAAEQNEALVSFALDAVSSLASTIPATR
jgi:hypothetical protein